MNSSEGRRQRRCTKLIISRALRTDRSFKEEREVKRRKGISGKGSEQRCRVNE
jgi:hypothetical protein